MDLTVMKPFRNKVFNIGVYESEGNAQATAQVALGKGIVLRKFVEDLEGPEVFGR
jgi:hypothetical protein